MTDGYEITIRVNPLEIKFTVGSIAEAVGVLTDEGSALAKAFDQAKTALTGEPEVAQEAKEPKPKRGRPAKDPANASAPPPAPIPAAPPVLGPENANGIPEGLVRTAPPAPAAPPPPAPVPNAAPTFEIGKRIAAHVKAGGTDEGRKGQWVAYLAGKGVVAAAATFDEAVTVLEFLVDDKAKPIATELGVS